MMAQATKVNLNLNTKLINAEKNQCKIRKCTILYQYPQYTKLRKEAFGFDYPAV